MEWKLELVVVPVSDVDRTKTFYTEKVGFNLDVDHRADDNLRVVQLTPPGPACSISIGIGITEAAPGSLQGLHLVVSDIDAARSELVERGVDVSDIQHISNRARGCLGRIPYAASSARSPSSAIPTATVGSCKRAGKANRGHEAARSPT